MNNDLQQLILLQELDVEIRQLQEEIAALPLRQAALEGQFATAVAEYLELKGALDEARTARQTIEAEIETVQQRHQKFRNDLMKATNEREYTTSVREIDISRKTIGNLETEALKLMEQIERLEGQVAAKTPEMETHRQEVDQQLSRLQSQVESAQQRLDGLLARRPEIHGQLAPAARADYDRLSRMKSGLALAQARDYSCQGCRMSLRPQIFNDIRRGDRVITCENCGRILYFVAVETA